MARRSELDEDAVEIVPGLIIIHHADGGDLAGRGEARAGAEDADAAPDYVNLFATTGEGDAAEGDDAAPTGAESEESPDESPEEFADRLRRMADEAPAGNGADYGWDDAEEEGAGSGGHFLRPGGADADEAGDALAEESPQNLFAAAGGDDAGEATGEVRNLFAADTGADEDDDALVLGGGEAPEPGGPAEGAAAEEGYTAASLAEKAKADKVSELMVSAAAFMVLIRGQGRFTRRDVLDVFETIPGDHEKTLEAQIKGFGKAVRNGQLVMIEDGVFGLSRAELDRFQDLL